MEPAIKTGSVVIVKEQEEYKEEDIITFTTDNNNDATVTHRITEIEETEEGKIFSTKGDANNVEDGSDISEEQVIGKVVGSIPLLGFPLAFSRTPMGFILLIIIPATLIIGGEFLNIKNEVKNIKKKKEENEKV